MNKGGPAVLRTADRSMFGPQRRLYASLPSHEVLGLPALSPTMTQGNLAKWLKKEGDRIQPGDLIASIETDKATVDWEVTEAGYIAKLLLPEGTKDIAVGKPAIITVEEAEDVEKFKDYTPESGSAAKEEPAKAAAAAAAAPAPKEATKPAPLPASAPASTSQSAPAAPSGGRVFASPLARKTAAEQGVNIAAVAGTGPNNRVVRADVVEYAASAPASVSAPAPFPGGLYTDIPTTQIRKVIAARLTESKQTVPHYYLTVECRVDKLLKLRQELNIKSDGSYKLSVNDFIIKAAALALQKKPTCNSAWLGDFIRRYHNVDINVAVSTDDGLFTPIVHDADKKGLVAISNTVKTLADKAKERKLQPNEFQGGTFTISNLGMFGVKQFAAVINPPQSCILAIGGTEKRVVPNEDKELQPYQTAHVLSVTLSADHRVVDGAVGADWLRTFKEYMEDPVRMLL